MNDTDPDARRIYYHALHMFKASGLPAHHQLIERLTDNMADLLILKMREKHPKACSSQLAEMAKKEIDSIVREKNQKGKRAKYGSRR